MGQNVGKEYENVQKIFVKLNDLQGKIKSEKDIVLGKTYKHAITITNSYLAYLINIVQKFGDTKVYFKDLGFLKEWIEMIKAPDTSDNGKANEAQDNDVGINYDDYTDDNIYKRFLSYYKNNEKTFKEKLFKGPPDCFRWLSWCVINQIPLYNVQYKYNHYLVKHTDDTDYNKYLILKDVNRSVEQQMNLGTNTALIKDNLYNVLKAFYNLDMNFGLYCQGTNLIVVFLLITSEGNDVDTFNMLISLLTDTFLERKENEYSFRGLFCDDLPLLVLLLHIFDCKLKEKLPELKNHLDSIDFDSYNSMTPWFQTLFTKFLPLNMLQRLWDCMFSDGVFFMVKFAIAFYDLIKDDLMKMEDLLEVRDYMNELSKSAMATDGLINKKKYDVEKLIEKAKKIQINPKDYMKSIKKNPRYEIFKENIGKAKNYKVDFEFEQYDINADKIELTRQTIFSKLTEEELAKKIKEPVVKNQINDEKEKDVNKNEIKNEIKDEKK